jgi:hypothetical protein
MNVHVYPQWEVPASELTDELKGIALEAYGQKLGYTKAKRELPKLSLENFSTEYLSRLYERLAHEHKAIRLDSKQLQAITSEEDRIKDKRLHLTEIILETLLKSMQNIRRIIDERIKE